MKTVPALLVAGVLTAVSLAAGAQTPGQASPSTTTTTTATTSTATTGTTTTAVTTANGGESAVQGRIVSSFSGFAGSEENARSLVTGLRQGSEITLATPGSGGQAGTSTTFTPPTRPMGYGNVRIALSLARAQLAQAGITEPTPDQLSAALMGGSVTNGTGATATTTEFQGVLQMRADGMGWGQIANSMGVKLGHVMSGRVPPPASTSPAPPASATLEGGAGTGITTAAGGTSATAATRGRGNSASAHQSQRAGAGAGIVTAAGDTAVGASAGARAQGGGIRAGVVTGAGAASGSRASATGRARGKAHASP